MSFAALRNLLNSGGVEAMRVLKYASKRTQVVTLNQKPDSCPL